MEDEVKSFSCSGCGAKLGPSEALLQALGVIEMSFKVRRLKIDSKKKEGE